MSFTSLLKRPSSTFTYLGRSLATKSISGSSTTSRAFNRFTVVDFYADWCGPCKMLSPALTKLTAEPNRSTNGQAYDLLKVDIDTDEGQTLARQYDVAAVPTVIAFRDNVVISQFRGALPEPSVKQWLDSLGKA
ncbi:thioredoxin-like protein [Crepidotus variabilis]|uniref:Thioredoxin-like protein n=1 Tax=Crepidotus variabilis TaxID=179855 RepID=A0A9P6ENN9_9AGAR|nr:thioredoxin-like protein [Crepidotus variabilis]